MFRELRTAYGDSDNDLLRKLTDSIAISIGQRGHDVYGSPGVHTGEWVVLHVLGTVAATVALVRDGGAETLTIAAGDRIYGRITSVNALSGIIEVYKDN